MRIIFIKLILLDIINIILSIIIYNLKIIIIITNYIEFLRFFSYFNSKYKFKLYRKDYF